MDCFHHVTYGIFTLWFSSNQMFVIKFSVSFATVVERTRPSHDSVEDSFDCIIVIKESDQV